jgi:hypothetical protein
MCENHVIFLTAKVKYGMRSPKLIRAPVRGVPSGDVQDARASPLPPPRAAPPPGHVHPPLPSLKGCL